MERTGGDIYRITQTLNFIFNHFPVEMAIFEEKCTFYTFFVEIWENKEFCIWLQAAGIKRGSNIACQTIVKKRIES